MKLSNFVRVLIGLAFPVAATAAPLSPEDQSVLAQPGYLYSLQQISDARLDEGNLGFEPWSTSYWPVTKGVVAQRFADPGFPASRDFSENHKYILANPADKIVASKDETKINQLSPAEKYDLLVGDRAFTMTRLHWKVGERYMEQYGYVPSWVGLDHGTAPASLTLPNPRRSVRVQSVDGIWITFNPSDIKALGSLLWANAPSPVSFLGSRCKQENPEQDGNGRAISPACFDTNPGAFHLAMVNLIGLEKRGVVADVSAFHEVWNHPIVSYKFAYAHPVTKEIMPSALDAIAAIAELQNDKLKDYRSPGATHLIFVSADITYSTPVQPSTQVSFTGKYLTVRWLYELELDKDGKILGGEWVVGQPHKAGRQQSHPDFLWIPRAGWPITRVESELAIRLSVHDWDYGKPLPAAWKAPAMKAAERREPLSVIVQALFNAAN